MKTRPRKRFGQHWLKSATVLNQIIQAATLSSSDHVLEIGPGQGVLTEKLLSQVEQVVSVEIDRDLCADLRLRFDHHPRFYLLEGDFLAFPFGDETSPPLFQGVNKVVANIPYNITGPILDKLLGAIDQPQLQPLDSIVLLLQNEVAQRLAAKPGSKTFGSLSVRCQYLANSEILCKVPPTAFKPAPKVESAVIRLTPRPFPTPATRPRWMGILVKQGFSTRRKMLRNTLMSIVDRSAIEPALEKVGAIPEARAESLSVEQWVALSEILNPVVES